MASDTIVVRSSKGWYVWAAASVVAIVADMAVHGVRAFNIGAAMLLVVFVIGTFSGQRAQDRVIAYARQLPPRTNKANPMPLNARYDLLGLLSVALWALWCVLLASSLAFSIIGKSALSNALTDGMIALVLAAAPIRIFIAFALFR
jgi:hypothetical protein